MFAVINFSEALFAGYALRMGDQKKKTLITPIQLTPKWTIFPS